MQDRSRRRLQTRYFEGWEECLDVASGTKQQAIRVRQRDGKSVR